MTVCTDMDNPQTHGVGPLDVTFTETLRRSDAKGRSRWATSARAGG